MKLKGPDGTEREATPVAVETSREQWNEYLCSDGTVLRVKLVLTAVFRIDGAFDMAGQPSYIISSSNVLAVNAPDSLSRRLDP